MGKQDLIGRIKDKISDLAFAIFLKVNGITKEQYYRQWIGYSEEELKREFPEEEKEVIE